MGLKEILAALGLPAEATEEQTLQALTGLQEQLTASRNRLRPPTWISSYPALITIPPLIEPPMPRRP